MISPVADTVAAGSGDRPPIPVVIERGTSVGRYLVLGTVGMGGMGVVYEAYDPKLDRRVALKALHQGERVDTAGQARLVQEAQAMARLSHPNVVTVYDVLVDDDRAMVAMELVEGQSLRGWLAERVRPWREVVGAFVQAGRGLAAAHAAGIVHGDFKADNVLAGKDGRARVGDFGLALATTSIPPMPVDAQPAPIRDARLANIGSASTLSGAVAGTPAYMAPEQLRGSLASERSDQFAFCVALYEALYGAPPFDGTTILDLASSIESQRFRPLPPGNAVPGWIRAAVSRGLRAKQDERFPSMAALVDALEDDPTKRRKGRAIAAVVGLAGIAAVGAAVHKHRADVAECRNAGERITSAWDASAKAAVHAAFLVTKRPYAEDTFARATRALDAYVDGWSRQATASCEAWRRGAVDPLAPQRASCMDARMSELHAFVDVLERADPGTVDRAVTGARALVGTDVCQGRDPVRGESWPSDPSLRADAQEIAHRLLTVNALEAAGRYKEGLEVARSSAEAAERIGFEPLVAQALVRLATLQTLEGHELEAAQTDQRAILAAERTGEVRAAVRAWSGLANVANDMQKFDLALERLDHAEAWAGRAGDDEAMGAKVWLARGTVLSDAARYDESRALLEKALPVFERLGDDDEVDAWNVLGIDDDLQGKRDEARGYYERVVGWWEKTLGPDNPRVAAALENLGEMTVEEGKIAEGTAELERALAIDTAAFGRVHPASISAEYGLAEAYIAAGRAGDALRLAQEAATGAPKVFGPGSKDEVNALLVVSKALFALDRPADVIDVAEREVALREKNQVDGDLANAQATLGFALVRSGRDPKRGRALLAQARAGLIAAATPDNDWKERVAEIDQALGAR